MVVRLTGHREAALTGGYAHPFTDVADWGDPYVGYAYAAGITQGVSGTSFGFSSTISQEEYLTLLLRALGYADVDWRDPYAEAARAGLREGEDYYLGETFLRSDMVILSAAVLDVKLSGGSITLLQSLEAMGALEERTLPAASAAGFQPGPVSHAPTDVSVADGTELLEQFALQVAALNPQVTFRTPIGQEQAFSRQLLSLDSIQRFPEVDALNSTIYPGAGYFTVEIIYRDSSRVMAYAAGKTSALSAADQALYQEALRVRDAVADPSMSQYEQVKAFHDYLCRTVTYRDQGESSHTAYGALVNHAAVCQGYTQAMDLLCFLSGIDCAYIFGSAGGEDHSWVRVKVDGQWYNVDATWDDQPGGIIYDYFLRSDAAMAADHSWTAYPHWPVCPADYPA